MPKEKRKKILDTTPTRFDEDHWRAEEDLRSIARAFAVKKDPERMKAVKAVAKQKLDENKRQKEEAEKMIDLGEGKDIGW